MKKVLIADKMSIEAEKVFIANSISFDIKVGLSEDEICNIVEDYDGIIVRSATKITKKIIDSSSKLKVLGRAGIGVDNIDIETATAKGPIEIRRIFHRLNKKLISLKRIGFASLKLGNLREGEYRELTHNEINKLCSL